MAYTESGQGWYANSDWMCDRITDIATLIGSATTVLRIPEAPGAYNMGPMDRTFAGKDAYISIKTATAPCYLGVSCYSDGVTPYYHWIMSREPFVYRLFTVDGSYNQEWGNDTYDSTLDVYYGGGHAWDWDYNMLADRVPVYTTREVMYSSIYGEHSFRKTTLGYSVTCMCKWRVALGGDVYCSPILISDDPNYTIYSRNNAVPSVAPTTHTFHGITFYMRKAPLDKVTDADTINSNFPILDYSDSAPITNDLLFALIAAASELGVGSPPELDPYDGAGESEPGGDGDGDFDFSSTDIPVPSLPSIGAMDAGFVQLYKMSSAELKSLAAYMWSGSFDPDNFRKLFADPMDAILGCSIIPTDGIHPSAAYSEIKIGNVGTGVLAPKCSEQYFEVDCGTVQMPAKWGAYLDYAPYSKLSLYLPYIGMVPISPDDCMGGSITVKYHIDILSGSCCVYVYCYSNRGADGHLLYVFNGSCACVVPVTAGQYTNAVFGILGAIGGIANTALSIVGATQTNQNGQRKGLSGVGGITGGIEEAFGSIQGMIKPEIQRSGNIGASAGLMGPQYPFLVLNIPHMAIPGQQNVYQGYPSFVTKRIGDLSGYTEMQVSHLNGMTCTQSEANEIIELLSKGVIL